MRKIVREIVSAIIVIAMFVGIFGAGYWYGRLTKGKIVNQQESKTFDLKLPGEVERRTITKNEVETKLIAIGELSTYMGEYEVERTEEQTRYMLDNIPVPGTTNEIGIKCVGIVKVGYDMEDIVVKVDNESQKIYVAIPEPDIKDNYIKWDSIENTENNNILNPIEFSQYQNLFSELEEQGLEDAIDKGVYDDANSHLKEVINSFLSCFEDYQIEYM